MPGPDGTAPFESRPFAGKSWIFWIAGLTLLECDVPATDPARVQFNALHVWSTRLEGGVFLLGLLVVYLTAALPQ